ncbi:transposase [Evansella cellulosilytica]|uniref:transposase n=1 Tax=Evansella cellulosilytica TaxID=1413 RepID=UPI003CCADEFF
MFNRKSRRDTLFYKDDDFIFFLNILHATSLKYPFKISAYCLMKNHYHLQIFSNHLPLSPIMEQINKLYARYFNHKYNHSGPLFEDRFKSIPVKDNHGMITLSRYIHYNPVHQKNNRYRTPEVYKWSSYTFYLPSTPANEIPTFLDTTPILNQFQGNEYEKKARYIDWCKY